MSRARFVVGDALAVLPTLDPGSVDLVVTSPPFLALRSYLPADHPDKALEHGSEPTPAAFLATLLDVTELLGRVLAPHGSIAVELGDTYAGSGGGGGDYLEGGMREGQQQFAGSAAAMRESNAAHWRQKNQHKAAWPLPKSLVGVPGAYQLSLAYGRNILALPGQPEWREFAPWRVRNKVAWVRNNPPPGALGDKWRHGGSTYITVATRSATRWWDDIATRKPHTEPDRVFNGKNASRVAPKGLSGGIHDEMQQNPAGAPLLDWWNITPTGYTSRLGAHYATFPDELVTPLVQAMCPRRVCRTCGTPSRRLLGEPEYVNHRTGKPATTLHMRDGARRADGVNQWDEGSTGDRGAIRSQATIGWSSCGCPGADGIRDDGYHTGPAWRPGLVLDPYAGTGTTLVVATGHSRDAVGIDLNPANAVLAEERLGMFLDVDGMPPLGSMVDDDPRMLELLEQLRDHPGDGEVDTGP